MYCHQCGFKIDAPDAQFCPVCGAALGQVSPATEPDGTTTPPAPPPQQPGAGPHPPPVDPVPPFPVNGGVPGDPGDDGLGQHPWEDRPNGFWSGLF